MLNKNLDFKLREYKNLYRIYSVITSIYFFFRFVFFTCTEKSIRLLRYYPGHYSSSIPSKKFLDKNQDRLFQKDKRIIRGINLNKESQLELVKEFFEYSSDFIFPENQQADKRYYYVNPMFGFSDAFILYSFLKKYKPNNLIEIGSGYSSALILDSIDITEELDPKLTFIEPYPSRLYGLLSEEDSNKATIIEKNIQNVSLDIFSCLESNDILFVDTSHVLKIDSDLSKIIFSILPILNKGVLIHFHDIFWPFEYPKAIFDDGRLWNESYFLRSFLQFNDSFEIVYFSSYIEDFHKEEIVERIPEYVNTTGSSLWLRKIK